MALWQGDSRRKKSGGRRVYTRNKRKFELGSEFQPAIVSESEVKKVYDGMGQHKKSRIFGASHANVLNKKTKRTKRAKIITVKENTANPHYVQRNIVTKGAVVLTDIGTAKVTSRPGRDGVVNAVLIEGGK